MQHIVVTGVSTGIGQEIARTLAHHGMHVFGSVRHQADATLLANELGERFTPLIFDVTNEVEVHAAAAVVRAQLGGETLAGLVNNAGVAVPGPLQHIPIAAFRQQVDINLTGPLIVTQAFAPLLGATSDFHGTPGRIIMISSVGGRLAGPFLGPYHASKFGLEGLSDTLRRELMLYGIDVIVVEPGAVATPIWKKAEAEDISQYATTDYAPMLQSFANYMIAGGHKGLPPADIGKVVRTALTSPHPHVRYAVLRQRFLSFTMPRLLPPRLVDRTIARNLHMQRKPQR